jgi:hypothetical protein
VQVTGASVHPDLDHILVEVQVAGQIYRQSVPALPYQTFNYVWDGLDAFGRALQGERAG